MSDIKGMTDADIQTKQCPFCAETIQARAIKCRFCGEYLNSDKAKALQTNTGQDSQESSQKEDESSDILFAGSPSLLGMGSSAVKGILVLVLAITLMMVHFEKVVGGLPGLRLSENSLSVLGRYRIVIALGLAFGALAFLAIKILRLKMTYYEITPVRIEWARGLVNRKVDNLDMFRIIDLKLRMTAFDSMVGIGTVVLITTDKTDPEFVFEKVRNPRQLYDAIKKAALDADRRGSVVHLE